MAHHWQPSTCAALANNWQALALHDGGRVRTQAIRLHAGQQAGLGARQAYNALNKGMTSRLSNPSSRLQVTMAVGVARPERTPAMKRATIVRPLLLKVTLTSYLLRTCISGVNSWCRQRTMAATGIKLHSACAAKGCCCCCWEDDGCCCCWGAPGGCESCPAAAAAGAGERRRMRSNSCSSWCKLQR